ncbi:vicilin-like seed storage protein At2g18540 [Osmia bicornis bicornis]|uniref:vicilin-like seed storage protein At2g18540 n=1 Tax=Osmia bicornis bicornis TaxID=1437191 RepID=UPI001EAEEA4F|nr:vicilin-like seed storage protein At2g18540 [Osmia bicornis bicornis]
MDNRRELGEEIRELRKEIAKLREEMRGWRIGVGEKSTKEEEMRDKMKEEDIGKGAEAKNLEKSKEKDEEESRESRECEEKKRVYRKEKNQEEEVRKREGNGESKKELKGGNEGSKETVGEEGAEKRAREEEERKKRWIAEDEKRRSERRKKSLAWRGVEGENLGEKVRHTKIIMEKELGVKVIIKGATEREGEGGRSIVITELEEEDNKKEMVWMRNGIWDRWRVEVDEGLNKEERRLKWMIKEKAKKEKEEGRSVLFNSRRIWVEGKEIKWCEERKRWERVTLRERLERGTN